MRFIADFHIHSRYSRATSKEMEVETLARYAEKKGVHLLGTGDFTHPAYFAELRRALEPLGNGLFQLREKKSPVRFILTAEVSNIFSVRGKVRRIHTLIFSPSLEAAEKMSAGLSRWGKLSSDGRPVLAVHVKEVVKLALGVSPDCLLVPAHAWTPWFSVFGSRSGFDSLEECFEEEAPNIYALETGLSSDPPMNWRISALDTITLISNSDAHSPSRIGREANVFNCSLDYLEIIDVLKTGDPERFSHTIEFFPREGKYHWDGHRKCGVVLSPEESKAHADLCPRCGKKLTLGVMHRVDALADRPGGYIPQKKIPYKWAIPLDEIIAEAMAKKPSAGSVKREYERIIQAGGPELDLLLERSRDELESIMCPEVVEGIMRIRRGEIEISPGYDGVYGKVNIFKSGSWSLKKT